MWKIIIKQKEENNFDGKTIGTIRNCSSEDDAIAKAHVSFGKRKDVWFETVDESKLNVSYPVECSKCTAPMIHSKITGEFISAICQDCADKVANSMIIKTLNSQKQRK